MEHPERLPDATRRMMSRQVLAAGLRAGLVLCAVAAAGLAGCAYGDVSTQPSDIDFGGNGLSHGHP